MSKKNPIPKPFLTSRQRKFCRLYIKYEEDHVRASKETYVEMKHPAPYGADLLRENPKIRQYLDYLRYDAYETILDEEGRQLLSIASRAREYLRLIEMCKEAKRYRDMTELKGLLDRLVGRRRCYSINLAHYNSPDDKRGALQDALAFGELEDSEVKMLSQTIKDNELGTPTTPINIVIPPNNRTKEVKNEADTTP